MADLDIIREIDEDLRREKLLGLWKYLARYIIAVSLLVVLGTVGVVLWQNHREAFETQLTSDFSDAAQLLEQQKFEDAAKAFSGIRERAGHGGVASMAALREAYALLNMNKRDEARAIYAELAKDTSADPAARDLAILLLEGLSNEKNAALLASLPGGGDAPFMATWAEFAAAKALEEGKPEEALLALNKVKDRERLPPSLQARLNELEGAALSRTSAAAAE